MPDPEIQFIPNPDLACFTQAVGTFRHDPPTLEHLLDLYHQMLQYKPQPNQIIMSRETAMAAGLICNLCEGKKVVQSIGDREAPCPCPKGGLIFLE